MSDPGRGVRPRDRVTFLGEDVRDEHGEAARVGGPDELFWIGPPLATAEARLEGVGEISDGATLG